jgi:hypothetical protein
MNAEGIERYSNKRLISSSIPSESDNMEKAHWL